jgi:hypothetical protein
MQEPESSPAANERVTPVQDLTASDEGPVAVSVTISSEKAWDKRENRRRVVLDTMAETKVIEDAVRLACLPVLVSAAWSRDC